VDTKRRIPFIYCYRL